MNKIRNLLAVVGLSLSLTAFANELVIQPIPGIDESFIRGADISSLAQIEESGGIFYDLDGIRGDLLAILRRQGVNWVRLRLWHTPVNELPVLEGGRLISNRGQRVGGGTNDLERTLSLAKRAKSLGFKVLLDIHYSDFWADPGKQNKPAAWKKLTGKALETAVYSYTRETLKRMIAEAVKPDMVQIGNELNNGMLWPDGKIWGSGGEKVGGMNAFIALLDNAARGVRDAEADAEESEAAAETARGDAIPIAIHLADGGDNGLYRAIFDPVTASGLDFQVIGLSFYTYWHGSPESLADNLADLAARYGKDLVVMETAYGFTEADGDDTGNVFKVYDGETGGYRATPQGQATAVRDVMAAVARAGGKKGRGAFYWEPGWIPVPGAGWRTGEGDSWENQAMFDFSGYALPSLAVFSKILPTAGGGSTAGVGKPSSAEGSKAAFDKEAADAYGVKPVESEAVRLTVSVGDRIALPPRVKVSFSDDSFRYMETEWNPGSDGQFHGDTAAVSPGEITLNGTVKGTKLGATAFVTVTRIKNLVPDPSFEAGKLDGWTYLGPQGACFAENNGGNAYTGKWTYKYWLDKPFKSTLTRTFTALANGTYALKCRSMGGGGENSIRLFATDFGGSPGNESVSAVIKNSGWQKWVSYETPPIKVSGGSCTIGIEIDAKAGNWGNFDDVEFYLADAP